MTIQIENVETQNKISNLRKIKQSIEDYRINFDMTTLDIKSKGNKLNSPKYLSSVFKHSDGKYYVYVKL